ncbi:hypothetical protein BHS06_33180 [Myxococcus xanthus]|nr:hypothetical protein BHS06_33180 [Myxococcus xanthus]
MKSLLGTGMWVYGVRATSSFMTSFAPARIRSTRVSANRWAMGYAFMYPSPPNNCKQRSATMLAGSVTQYFAIVYAGCGPSQRGERLTGGDSMPDSYTIKRGP